MGGAIEVAAHLPSQLGADLIGAAREAFVQGIHVAATLSVIGAIGLAVFTAVLLRRVGVGTEPVPQLDPSQDGGGLLDGERGREVLVIDSVWADPEPVPGEDGCVRQDEGQRVSD